MTTLPQTGLRLPRGAMPVQQLSVPGVPVAFPAQAAAAHQMTGADIWRVIRSHIWLIIAFLAASAVAGFFINMWLLRYHAKYLASGIVQVSPPINTNVLKSDEDRPDIAILFMEQKNNAQLLKNEALYAEVLSNETSPIRNTAWYRQFASPALAEQDLKDNLVVTPSVETSQIVVEFAAHDPTDGKKIIQSIVDQRIADEVRDNAEYQQQRSAQLTAMQQSLEAQRAELADDLHDKEMRLNISDFGGAGRLNVKEAAMADLVKSKMDAELKFTEAQEVYQELQNQIANNQDPPYVLEALNHDPEVLRYRELVENYDTEMVGMGFKLGNENDEVNRAKAEKDVFSQRLAKAENDVRLASRAQLLDEARHDVDGSKMALDRYNQEIASLDSEISDLNKDLGDYHSEKDRLDGTNGINKKLQDVNDKLEEIAQFTHQKDQTILAWKAYPDAMDIPSFPKLSVTMTLSVLAGLCLSLGFAFARELMDTTVRSPRDITRIGNMTVLGMVPHEDDDPQAQGTRLPLVIFEAPQSMIAEQLRQVRTRLQHAASLDTTRTILITSPSPDDGKSTIAANLAAGLALNGRRILLVDANFRRPSLHRVFSIANDVGFGDVLNKLDAFESAVQETQVPNLYVLPSGVKPGNATELLESQLLIDFIERALEEFDHVIFDSGPLLLVSETAALAPRVDGVVTVVRARTNSRGLLQRMRDSLRQIKAEHLGVVLNAVRSQGGGYYRSNMRTFYDYQNGHAA